ncbi:hypothetical protein ACI0X9_003404 [Cronobacter turicensis]
MYGLGLGFYGLAPVINAKPAFHYSNFQSGTVFKRKLVDTIPLTPKVLKEKFITAGLAISSIPVIFMIATS